jgi:hypothetical protein
MRRFLLLFPLLIAAAPAGAEQWRVAAYDAEGPGGMSVGFVDTAGLVRAGDEIDFPFQVRFSDSTGPGDGLRARLRVDCRARRYQILEVLSYRGEMRLTETPAPPAPEAGIEPGTNIAVIIEAACSGRYLTEPVDPIPHAREVFERQRQLREPGRRISARSA